MAENLIDTLKRYITPDIISNASGMLGESESGVSNAISASIPTVLSGLIHKSNNPGIMDNVMGLINSTSASSNVLNHFTATSTGQGSELLSVLFGGKQNDMADKVARLSGIKGSSAQSILAMVATAIMGYFAKSGLTLSGLTNLLSSQRDSIMGAIPSGLNLGFGSHGTETHHTAKTVHTNTGSGLPKWLLPLVLIAAAILAIYFFTKGCNRDEMNSNDAAAPVDTTATEIENTNAETTDAGLGSFNKLTLPNGVELNAPEFGIENKLNTWLMDPSKKVDKTTWFNFDRLLFDTGKATLRPESQEQLKNIVEILKAYPAVALKIGGYTDNVGDSAANLKLSSERAKSVMNEMVTMGISAQRLEAEGYGDQHPVASNDTEEGRAQNRRIALRVTKK